MGEPGGAEPMMGDGGVLRQSGTRKRAFWSGRGSCIEGDGEY